MKANDARKQIQELLDVGADGIVGPKTLDALRLLGTLPDEAQWPLPTIASPSGETHKVKASSFADKADVSAFKHCKALGGSDQECFKRGDNGVGFTGSDCTDESIPYIALPPEKWKPKFGSAVRATGAGVNVTIGGKTVLCFIGDTMPHEANITNGAGIDLAPGAQKAFGLHAPFMVDAEWSFA